MVYSTATLENGGMDMIELRCEGECLTHTTHEPVDSDEDGNTIWGCVECGQANDGPPE